ncbi:MAG: hypothetical protein WC342_07655 [Methanoregula sp.]
MNSKAYIILAAVCAVIVISIAVIGIGENRVSNLYLIPSGVFDPAHDAGNATGQTPPSASGKVPDNLRPHVNPTPDDSLYAHEIVLASYGNRNRTAWIDSTHATSFDPVNFTGATSKDLESYFYPKGPVIGYGHDIAGVIIVMYYNGTPFNKTLSDEMYTIISAKGNDYGFEQIPCRVISMEMVRSDIAKDPVTPRITDITEKTGLNTTED